ncbi:ciliogenesis and planar polarity effector 1 isoform X3 [Danio rerio]|uniref:Ciliogenesis and planar polarity effector 1 isoform X3 n=1 Tax=Danio rerio TaxID=7955 RepID=A0A8M9QC82_DANRE
MLQGGERLDVLPNSPEVPRMEVKLEVLLSSSIKRRKPWPRFCWLGREKEGVFLLDDNRISEIHLSSGRTKKKTPKLQPLLQRVVTMSASQNGMWLAGLLVSGELFLWNKDKDLLKTVSAVPEVHQLLSHIKASLSPVPLSLLVSESAQRVVLAALTGQVFLWECSAPQDLSGPRDGIIAGHWSQISCQENTPLPSTADKEASLHCVLVKSQAVGDVCLSAFVFTAEAQLIVTFLKIQWDSTWDSKLGSAGFRVNWISKSYPLNQLQPPCKPVKSRGALVPAFSPDGQLLAVVLNQKDPRATQVLFISTLNFVTVSSLLGGCGVKVLSIPAKYVRSYWVCCVSWMAEGLYLACVLRRGSLLMLARLAGLVSLSTTGSSLEFSASHFLPLHPLVTYRPPGSQQAEDGGQCSSSVSLRDPLRQRYSVTCHHLQPFLLVSDGYMVTVLRMSRRPSAAALVSSLLMDAAQGLEDMRRSLAASQPQARSWLESMSSLTLTGSFVALKEKESLLSTLPLYLQDTGDSERAQDEEDSDEAPCVRSHMEDEGRLEFASMFDTLHAHTHSPTHAEPLDLKGLHRSVITAWALCVSLSVPQPERLLRFSILCIGRLMKLLQLSDSSRRTRGSWVTPTIHTFRTLLGFLPWDASRSCLNIAVELCRCFVEMFLPISAAVSSQSFSAALLVLQQASQSINQTYSLLPRTVHYGEDDQLTYSSDMFSVPVLREDADAGMPPQTAPSKRLLVIWREVYRQALGYQEELHHSRGQAGVKGEIEKMSLIIPQIQQALQSAGERLEESHALCCFTGEQHFILGEYSESVRVWRNQLWAERERAGLMACYLETRCCLALLYCQLFQYRLRDAQALCDRLALLLHPQTGPEEQQTECDELVLDAVGREAACAVVQSLARFMAAYFTNQPLFILPPHNVDVLPPLHLPHPAAARVVELSQSRVSMSLRSDQLSEVWTVDYALELLLLGGLMPEAVWMAQRLGDWKMAASLSLAYSRYCSSRLDFSRLQWRELHLPSELKPAEIFQEQLEVLLSPALESEGETHSDAADVEDVDTLQASVQEILKASVMAELDVLSQPITSLLDAAKERATSLSALVPAAFYLPAPPLYCPQPSANTQDHIEDPALLQERACRSQVSGLLQKLLLLFRASHSSRPAAQWYISSLKQCRHALNKIQKRASVPKAELIPDGLKKFSTHDGFFHSGDPDSVTAQIIMCFRELCALCWMLHVRDQLSVSCRKYQSLRKQEKSTQLSARSVSDLCVEALCWARRLLPFCRFLNAEETLQDLVLSLLSELTPSRLTAETLARVFPDELESVRVPLREKYTSLLQRLKPVTVPVNSTADEDGESVMVVVQDELRRWRRELQRREKSVCAAEPYLWEREEEEDRGAAGVSILHRLSLGTSLSDSTLTDCGRPLVYSEGDTLSEPLTPQQHNNSKSKLHDAPEKSTRHRKGKRSCSIEPSESKPRAPTVGSWDFELEDDEFLLFLDLFLSYVLEKDRLEAEEFPLLSSFCQPLRSHELHSVNFDMLTALRRRQRDGRKTSTHLPLFRAGRCFQTVPITPERPQSGTTTNTGGPHGKHQGLFSLRQQAALMPKGNLSDVKIVPQAEVDVQIELDSSLESRFPDLARLLEWMMRWAERRVLLRKTTEGRGLVVMRVRGSSPAVLTALELLERRYSAALLGENTHHTHSTHRSELHQREESDVPLLPSITDWRRSQESNLETSDTSVDEAEGVDETEDLLSEHEDTLISDQQSHITELRGDVRHTTAAEHGESSVDDVTELSLANQSRAHRDQALTMADLESQDSDEQSLQSLSEADDQVSSGAHRCEASESESSRMMKAVQTQSGAPPEAHREAQSDGVRQLLQDELFRLVQLQQINFMSLMQVVGASFANLPLPQANLHQPGGIPPQPSSVTQNIQQNFRDDTNQPTQECRPDRVGNSQDDDQRAEIGQRNPPSKTQEIEHLTIRSDWPEDAQTNSRSFIPTSQGLLTTANHQASCSKKVSEGQPRAAPQAHGLRLLQLHPPQTLLPRPAAPPPPHHAPFPHAPPSSYAPPSTYAPPPVHATPPYAQPPSSSHALPPPHHAPPSLHAPPLHDPPTVHAPPSPHAPPSLHAPPLHSPPSRLAPPYYAPPPHSHALPLSHAPLPHAPPPPHLPVKQAWGQSGSALGVDYSAAPPSHLPQRTAGAPESLRLPPAAPRSAPVGLPLLRFHPDAQRPVTLPHIPQTPALKPPNLSSTAANQYYPRIQLLHREPDPPCLRFSSAPVRTPRLIPLEDLLRWSSVKQTRAEPKLQRIKTEPVPQNQSSSSPSSKRKKRREEKNQEQKPGVTFRPEDSIIPPDEPAEDEPDQDDGYTIPSGVFDSELSGLPLLDKAYVTSAELHAFASTQKRPAEIQDASTNTEADPPRSITDKAVSVQIPPSPSMPSAPEGGLLDVAPVVPPDVFMNLRYAKEKPSDQPENSSRPESDHGGVTLSPEGRRFINVVDLTDESLLENLPQSPPTSAQLHLLAASVVNHAPNPSHTFTPNTPEEIPEPSVVCTSPEAVLSGDPVTLSVLAGVRAPRYSLEQVMTGVRASRDPLEQIMMSRSQISARLSEMDNQLLRLQSIADHMDREFANTRLLVNHIETHSPLLTASVEKKPLSSSLRVIQEVRSFCPSASHSGVTADPQRGDQELLSSPELRSVHHLHSPLTVKPEQCDPDTNQDLMASLLEDPGRAADETLGVSGLSDVKDILSELIRDGALSRSVLGLSRSDTLHPSRSGVRMEDQRRDVRMWMRRKQRERLSEYRKQREEKRERERRPFVSPHTRTVTSVDLAANRKTKEERDRLILQEHHEQRARDACSLISDLLNTPLHQHTPAQHTLRSRSQSSGKQKRFSSSPSGAHTLGKTVVLQRKPAVKPHGSLSGRLGLHRPASALPADRLSQVTRRGMLSDNRNRQNRSVQHKMGSGVQSSSVKQDLQAGVEDTDELNTESVWSPADQEHRILMLDPQHNTPDLLDLDALSPLSSGSVLSRLDWAEIERLVADEQQQD